MMAHFYWYLDPLSLKKKDKKRCQSSDPDQIRMEFRTECFLNLNIWACDRKHAKHQYCLSCKSRCTREAFQHRYRMHALESLSLSLSLSTTCFQSWKIVWIQKISHVFQTGIPRINHVSELRTLRPMPRKNIIEPWHEISNNVVCGTSKASDQPAHMHRLIRAFASRLNILWVLSYWLNIVWSL